MIFLKAEGRKFIFAKVKIGNLYFSRCQSKSIARVVCLFLSDVERVLRQLSLDKTLQIKTVSCWVRLKCRMSDTNLNDRFSEEELGGVSTHSKQKTVIQENIAMLVKYP